MVKTTELVDESLYLKDLYLSLTRLVKKFNPIYNFLSKLLTPFVATTNLSIVSEITRSSLLLRFQFVK
jgi:hypothetical protein